VQIEKTAMFVILTLIVAVAAFNIVSALVMVVTDKQADIAILRTLGATPLSIMGIFIVQGITIGLIGTLLGLIGGVSLATHVDVVVPFIEQACSASSSGPGCVSDQRPALASAMGRCLDHRAGGVRAGDAGDALSGLAGGADPTGGGVAL
jgi:hypothetical protein